MRDIQPAPSSAPDRFEHRPWNFVSTIANGTYVVVGVQSRDEFNRIALRETDHGHDGDGHVLTKTLKAGGIQIVFQYWVKSRTIGSMLADAEQRRQAPAEAAPR